MATQTKEPPRVIVINSDMDALAANKLRTEFEDLAQNGYSDVCLDLTGVCFVDSSGIGALVFLFKRLKAVGRTLELKGVHGQPLDLFKYLRIDKSIHIEVLEDTGSAASAAMAQ